LIRGLVLIINSPSDDEATDFQSYDELEPTVRAVNTIAMGEGLLLGVEVIEIVGVTELVGVGVLLGV